MGKVRVNASQKKALRAPKSIKSEVFQDKQAENQLGFKLNKSQGVSKGNKTRNKAIDKGRVLRSKPKRVYTEKELGIPKLNTALNPRGVAVKGKKGKKFVSDDKMLQIIAEVNEETNAVNATKLEKARQLEEIREAKRKEIERKEQEKIDKLERKKSEVRKGKPKSKNPTMGNQNDDVEPKKTNSKAGKRKVRFQ